MKLNNPTNTRYYPGQVINTYTEIAPLLDAVVEYKKKTGEYPAFFFGMWFQSSMPRWGVTPAVFDFPITLLKVPDELRCNPPKERRRLMYHHELADVEAFEVDENGYKIHLKRNSIGEWGRQAIDEFDIAIVNGWPVYTVEGE